MPPISSIPVTRTSDILTRTRLLTQVQFSQADLYRVQNQIATGMRYQLPSEAPNPALRAIAVQGLLDRNTQYQANLKTNVGFLNASDTALASAASILNDVRATALASVGSTSTAAQRATAVNSVNAALQRLVQLGNQTFNGRSLFSGSTSNVAPYSQTTAGVIYRGQDNRLSSFSNLDQLFDLNVTGDEALGGFSKPVIGAVDLNPVLAENTPLTALFGGQGFKPGSIQVSDGTQTATVDLSSAVTVGDIARLLVENPPGKGTATERTVTTRVTATGLSISLNTGTLVINDLGGGTTAAQLGIARQGVPGPGPAIGIDLNPRLTSTTPLADLLGTRATAYITSKNGQNNIKIEAAANGTTLNGVTVTYVNDAAAGSETAVYNAGLGTLTVHIESGVTTASQVVAAINAQGTFQAKLDATEPNNNGSGAVWDSLIDATATAVTAGGSGRSLDQASGLQITSAGQTYTVNISTARTIEDLLNAINGSGANVAAEINEQGTGVNVRSRLSGADFAIGENGGTTAADLGIRSFATSTALADLNHGSGVTFSGGTDFVIDRRDGVSLNVNLTSGVVASARINGAAANDALLISRVQPGVDGNAFQVRITDSGVGNPNTVSLAGNVLTFNVDVATGFTAQQAITLLQGDATLSQQFVARLDMASDAGNDGSSNLAVAAPVSFSGGVSRAATIGDVLAIIDNDPTNLASATPVTARLATTGNGIELVDSNGAGVQTLTVRAGLTVMPGQQLGLIPEGASTSATPTNVGGAQVVTGRDVNPIEVRSVFTALLRLRDAIQANDSVAVGRAVEILDEAGTRLNATRGDLGLRLQSIDALQNQLDLQAIELQSALGEDRDVDLAEAIAQFQSRQAAFEAALRATGAISQLSLLDFL